MTRRIPVKLVRIDGVTEVSMDFDDFETSDVNIGNDVTALKKEYDMLIDDVRQVLTGNDTPSTTERWHACRKLADFVDKHSRFDIMNFSDACAKDLELSTSFRLMLSFGREFEASEVIDLIPYTSYRVLILKMSKLKRHNIFESEKKHLVQTKEHLNYKKYTRYLNKLHAFDNYNK